jgi:tetratricopeptide (TPR) repeat protein
MYHFAIEQLPDQPKPYYEMGFMHYLLGDFAGALDWFDRAADRVSDGDTALAPRVFYNRGLMRYVAEGDKDAAIADIKEALRRWPEYTQAKNTLKALRRRKVRWVPW